MSLGVSQMELRMYFYVEGDITASRGQSFDVIQFSISTSHTQTQRHTHNVGHSLTASASDE